MLNKQIKSNKNKIYKTNQYIGNQTRVQVDTQVKSHIWYKIRAQVMGQTKNYINLRLKKNEQ